MINEQRRQVVPTEWQGIRFCSKSEACFAMYIDHYTRRQNNNESSVVAWEYEPQQLILDDGYVPDFRVVCFRNNVLWCKLIEYKPSRPTPTYAMNVLQKLAILAHHVGMECTPCIQFGSFWENTPSKQPTTMMMLGGEIIENPGWATGDDDWQLRQIIGQQRFDLENVTSKSETVH